MRRCLSFVPATTAVLFAGTALANPISTYTLVARAMPGPHVQLTYARYIGPIANPIRVKSFGSTVTPWTKHDGFRTNLGSGIAPTTSLQMCDCYVPVGKMLGYEAELPPTTSGRPEVMSAVVTVPPSFDGGVPLPGRPGTGPDGGYWPWEIPNPEELQGIDCTLVCAGVDGGIPDAAGLDVPTGSGGAAGTGGVMGAGGAVDSGQVVDGGSTTDAGGALGKGGATGAGGTMGKGGATTTTVISGQGGATATTTSHAPTTSGGSSCSIAHGHTNPLAITFLLAGLVLALRRRRPS